MNLIFSKKVRITAWRTAIVSFLIEHESQGSSLSAEEVYALFKQRGTPISVATVYRVLGELARLGVIEKYIIRKGFAVYTTKAKARRIGHAMCRKCRQTNEFDDAAVRRRIDSILGQQGFTAFETSILITGLCARCSGEQEKPAPMRSQAGIGKP
jgi:Fur family transcriptional regulator, ferric uptake regulator